ncbi:MBL fold metallo-hydrolase [Peribacillus frigoritolerans]|uniref:MBL fold metallo-hydrolase n=1 Tax=Peribacillus frigoritolerans TaxID=450367 RepID=UPI00207A11AB|nr:MBL fold metallo-hydrolase [Peribacillus frigoritolerans]USK67591.1 hypothetical protein LIT26_13860 [Peribacillus frigoritolerans]
MSKAIKKEFGSEGNIIIPLPHLAFEQRMELDIGGVSCLLQYVGFDHSPDSIIVYIKEEKILFLGDSIYANIYSNKKNYTTQSTIQLLDTIDQLMLKSMSSPIGSQYRMMNIRKKQYYLGL